MRLWGFTYQQSPSRAARRMAGSALAPIHTGGCGFCTGRVPTDAPARVKCEPFMSTTEPLDRLEVLLEPPHALLLRGAEGEVFDVAIAEGHAQDDLAAAHHVHARDLLGDVERLVERQEHEAEVEPEVGRVGHDARQERELLQIPPRGG